MRLLKSLDPYFVLVDPQNAFLKFILKIMSHSRKHERNVSNPKDHVARSTEPTRIFFCVSVEWVGGRSEAT